MQEVARAVVGQRVDGRRGPPARIANTKVATNNQRYGHCHGVKAGTWSEDCAIGRQIGVMRGYDGQTNGCSEISASSSILFSALPAF